MSVCLFPRSPPAWLSYLKKISYLPHMSACHLPLGQNTILVTVQQTLLFCRAPTSFLVYCWPFYLRGEKGDVSSLRMEQQHWFHLVFLSYLFVWLLIL